MWSSSTMRSRLKLAGLWPESRLARIAWYLLALGGILFGMRGLLALFAPSWGASLGGWATFLAVSSGLLFLFLGFGWLKRKVLWRLRNRLIVTYVFIGVIPAVLLVAMAGITLYGLAGQFAVFVVTSEINSQLRSLEAVNAAVSNELAARLERGQSPTAESLAGLKKRDPAWGRRQVCAWYGEKPLPLCEESKGSRLTLPSAKKSVDTGSAKVSSESRFREIVRDRGELHLRVVTVLDLGANRLVVITSEPFDKELVGNIPADLGEISLSSSTPEVPTSAASAPAPRAPESQASLTPETKTPETNKSGIVFHKASQGSSIEADQQVLRQSFTVGTLPAPAGSMDREIAFFTPLAVVDWKNGDRARAGAVVQVRTRPSVLYGHLFAALAQLYDATKHVDRGDFSHRIPVKSLDQLSELALSFNSMTESIEKLILEQKEKQRLENELTIAQEVQAQLFPRQISELESLEVHGFCRPARTVSGDYYDFLTASSHKLILAVGDISGKGISAALLMATIHSAVRAYSMESMPQLREPVAVGAVAGSGRLMATWPDGVEVSPGALLGLLNHQLYESTPPEKYATLFLAVYDGRSHQLTYSNGGHLPPILIREDGSIRRLEAGGTVVGLFDNMTYDE